MALDTEAPASLADAEALFLQGKTEEAAALCNAALAHNPNEPVALKILGLVTLIAQKHAQALAYLERAEPALPNDFRVQLGLAEAKWGSGRLPDAIVHLRRVAELEPSKPHLRARLGLALLANGQFEDARAEMEALLRTAPDNASALTHMGVALVNLRRMPESIDYLRRAMQIDTASHAAPFHLGQALRDMGRIDEAIDALAEAVRRHPTVAHLRIALGDALWGRGRRAEGRDELKRATELDPNMLLAWTKFGDTEQQGNNITGAIACYEKAMALFNGAYDDSPFRLLGNALFMAQRTDEAADVMKSGLRSSFWYKGQPKTRHGDFPRTATLCALGRSNTPTDYIIDANFKPESICMLPGFDYPVDKMDRCFDVIFNSASDPDSAAEAIAVAEDVTKRLAVPVINPPAAMAGTMRHLTPEKLGGIDGLYVPPTRRFARKELLDSPDSLLAGLHYPVLLRPAGSHGGTGLVRIESQASLVATAGAMNDDAVSVTEYYDFAAADGLYRKLRLIFVDGQTFPFHLSISDHWLNHYYRTRTAQEDMLRAEEAMFLQQPETYLGDAAYKAAQQVAKRHDLGFFGLDGAIDKNGTLIVFECNATMLVRHRDQPSTHDHKRPAAEAIRSALTALLKKTARPAD